jgi:hypothetical protein
MPFLHRRMHVHALDLRTGIRRLLALFASACVIGVLLPSSAVANPAPSVVAEPDNTWGEFVINRTAMLEELAVPIEHCFAQHDDTDPNSPMFDGCFDWHSAVHAAYSLHLLYRETGEERYLEAAEAKIQPTAIADELEYMRTTIRNRENPYGFSWLLALVKVREEVTGKTDLRPLAEEAVVRIRALVDSLTPEQARQRVLIPAHGNLTWGLIHLQLWAEYTRDAELESFVQEKGMAILLDPALDGLCPVETDTAPDYREFFPPCLMRFAGVAQIWDVPHMTLRRWIGERVPADFWIERVTAPVRNHSHALNFSRAYALWHLWEATNNVQHRQNFTDLIRYQVSRPDLWGLEATLGYGVSHWVAQFGVRAIAQTYGGRGQPPR